MTKSEAMYLKFSEMFKTLNADFGSYSRRFYERFAGDWRATRGLSSPGRWRGAATCTRGGGSIKAAVSGRWIESYGQRFDVRFVGEERGREELQKVSLRHGLILSGLGDREERSVGHDGLHGAAETRWRRRRSPTLNLYYYIRLI